MTESAGNRLHLEVRAKQRVRRRQINEAVLAGRQDALGLELASIPTIAPQKSSPTGSHPSRDTRATSRTRPRRVYAAPTSVAITNGREQFGVVGRNYSGSAAGRVDAHVRLRELGHRMTGSRPTGKSTTSTRRRPAARSPKPRRRSGRAVEAVGVRQRTRSREAAAARPGPRKTQLPQRTQITQMTQMARPREGAHSRPGAPIAAVVAATTSARWPTDASGVRLQCNLDENETSRFAQSRFSELDR